MARSLAAASSFGLALLVATALGLVGTASGAVNDTLPGMFERPLMTRVWQYQHYALMSDNATDGAKATKRLDIDAVAAAIAGFKPTYVSSIIRLTYDVNLTDTMISDFNTIRSAVLAESPNAKFDVELNLNPNSRKLKPWPDAKAITDKMSEIDKVLQPDGWWLDYYSGAARKKPEWIAAINSYLQDKGQTVGGNIGGGGEDDSWIVPEGADIVAFTDSSSTATGYGFGIDAGKLAATQANITATGNGTVLLGHLRCDPQDGKASEPCVFMREWNATRRASYIEYWASQQAALNFTMMWPVFYPLCPDTYAYDPTSDVIPQGSLAAGEPAGNDESVYDFMRGLVLGDDGAGTSGNGTATPSGSTATTAATAAPSGSQTGTGNVAGRFTCGSSLRRLALLMLGFVLLT